MYVCAFPGLELLPPLAGSKRLTRWIRGTVYWSDAADLTDHSVARRRRTCKEQNRTREGMAKVASDQGSRRGHQCSETSQTGELGSIVSVGASLGPKQLPLWAGSKWLTNWTSETMCCSEAAESPQLSILLMLLLQTVVVCLYINSC